MGKVFITGTGMTKFGELWDYDLRKLAFEAITKSLNDSKLELKEIEAIYVSNMNSAFYTGQEHLGALISSELGLDVPAIHIEAACASGSAAINAASCAISSGLYKNVLVIGMEKMTDVSICDTTTGLASAADEEWESYFGVTFPSLYAMIAREHMRKFQTTKHDLGLVSMKNHDNASLNLLAQFPNKITMEAYEGSPEVASPLNLMDCSPISDGAAAVILSSTQGKYPVFLAASEIATGPLSIHDRVEITTIDSCVKAAKRAYQKADVTPSQIEIAEVHDCFTIAEILAYEDLGFTEKGKGALLIREGITSRKGRLPVNTSGGLKACGHPVGATGVKQAIEITLQLSGEAGERQIKKDMKFGLTQNVGGSGATCVVNIFEKNETR